MIICQTPFRVSFFGGGTDHPEFFEKHGGAVLGTAIDKFIYHSVAPFPSRLFDYSIRLSYRQVECVKEIDEIQHAPFREVLRELSYSSDVEINLAADLPSSSGLGSSSSFTVGLFNALLAMRGEFISKHDLAYRAIRMERQVLGETVGCQDQVMAAFGGFNLVTFHREDQIVVHRVPLSRDRMTELDESLMLFFTGFTRRAEQIEKAKLKRMDEIEARLKRMLGLVENAYGLLAGNQPLSAFGELLHTAWMEKRALDAGVSNPQIDRIYELGREAGALGGKLLGAGGGGFVLLFVPPERQPAVRHALRNYYEAPFHINAPGSGIIHS